MQYVHVRNDYLFDSLIEKQIAPEAQAGHEPSLQDELLDAGVPSEVVPDAVAILDRHAEQMGMRAAAEVLRRIALVVRTRGTGGAALARVLGLSGEHSLEELAAAFACSKQAISQCEQRLRATLAPLLSDERPIPRHVIVRPPQEGEWLVKAEAAKVAGVSVDVVAAAGRDGLITTVTHRNQHFYEEGSVLAWAEKHHLAIAEAEQRRDADRQKAPVNWC